jgi:prepilin-type processing-associated H-X9-DG protein
MKTKTSEQQRAFTLIDLLLIIAAIIAIAAIALPKMTRTRNHSPRISCVNNLKYVGLAFRIWAGDNNDKLPTQVSTTNGGAMEAVLTGNVAVVFQVMSNELSTPKNLFCPADKLRQPATFFSSAQTGNKSDGTLFQGNTSLSYFVNLDAVETNPNMFLSGDDNLLIGGSRHNPLSGSPATSGVLTLTTNSLIAWSEARHEKQGNVALADGSVQQLSTSNLRRAWETSGVETNRLAMP